VATAGNTRPTGHET